MMVIKDIVSIIYPEILLLIALLIAILLSTTKFKDFIWLTTTILMLTGCLYLFKNPVSKPVEILNGMFISDNLSYIFRLLTLIVAILIILGANKYTKGFTHKGEFMILMISSIIGIMFLVSANDLITLFVALEILSLGSVMLAGYSKYDLRSNEASLKYLLNSAAASAIFLFGLSIIYGLSGSTQLDDIRYKLIQLNDLGSLNQNIIVIALILIVGGLAFKLASAPFHMWSPDVYEGAPTPVTAFLSVASKAGGFAITLRLLLIVFGFSFIAWQPLIIILSLLSMLIGNFVALGEVINKASVKRLMAYSSIAQAGYILIGIALNTHESVAASIFYLIVYSIMNLGAFLCIIAFGNEANSDAISDYSGLAKKRPLLAFAFCVCLFNLAGLPIPPAGFIAKFILFKSAFDAGHVGIFLGTIALITTILSVFYYSYIVKLMVVDKPSQAVLNMDSNKESLGPSMELSSAILISVSAIFILSVVSSPILQHTNKLSKTINYTKQIISYKTR
ncbi:MAG: hypothetical protein A3I68_08295 [Candidatus Melainabacteria bacterium RIFCSPLOWO2_02_FULL_35_15]|nr:MAG: hypothetical protein A3F80_08520 [Candidatus Melainabacteria bacterium RIFCSPLOWO2_12_FULL_35_11]OGI13974.1 MAG: hypothetical protein A3I68_08295 [Candidatus Melainabacteria bacterium RIFCSPLOWO2_02_FULL_35_15]